MSISFEYKRVFKTKWFSKTAHKSSITDKELCLAITEVRAGLAENLGGGVYKKRLKQNEWRSIVLAKGEQIWVYQHLFAKQDQANIAEDELIGFRLLAKAYEGLSQTQIERLIHSKELQEICHDHTPLQK